MDPIDPNATNKRIDNYLRILSSGREQLIHH